MIKTKSLLGAMFLVQLLFFAPLSAADPKKDFIEQRFVIPGYSYFDYKEILPAPSKSTEHGWIPSLGFEYRAADPSNTWRFATLGQIGFGETVYDGSVSNIVTKTVTPTIDKTSNFFLTLETSAGRAFQVGRTEWTPYVGAGVHSWNRKLGGPSPYYETYSWAYFPVGLRMHQSVNSQWEWTLDASYRIMAFGNIELDPQLFGEAINLSLGNRPGWKVSAPITYHPASNFSISVLPWYHYSEIGKSETKTFRVTFPGYGTGDVSIYEPASTTHQYGVQAMVMLNY